LSARKLDIGDDDARLTKLRDAASDFQKRPTAEPRIGLYHTLMSFSNNVDPNDECFRESGEVLSQLCLATIPSDFEINDIDAWTRGPSAITLPACSTYYGSASELSSSVTAKI
jgi:hypothetical protein